MRKKMYVGLSGGVDSAVSAALLKKEGHEVIGAFIKIWSPEFLACTWREDRLDAMRVAAALEIPFREVDLSDQYKKQVVEHMVATYEHGMTPNPDVLCNEAIKFGSFFDWALAQGADAVATGHYARTEAGNLLRGVDAEKDQSYFLHRVPRERLLKTYFPIGGYQKAMVRTLAQRFALPNASRPDSQGLCFVGDITLPEFLSHYLNPTRGAVLDAVGATVGHHGGAMLYTIGQRHGFHLAAVEAKTQPHYVIAINAVENTITVSTARADAERYLAQVGELHWIQKPSLPATLLVQTRYRERPIPASIEETSGGIAVRFDTPHLFSPGQSLVLYDNDVCLGGGVIR